MDYDSAKELIKKIIRMVEDKDLDHHSVTEERQGNKRYICFNMSIKIE